MNAAIIKLVDVINGKMKVQMVPLVLSKLLKWKNTCLACVCVFILYLWGLKLVTKLSGLVFL